MSQFSGWVATDKSEWSVSKDLILAGLFISQSRPLPSLILSLSLLTEEISNCKWWSWGRSSRESHCCDFYGHYLSKGMLCAVDVFSSQLSQTNRLLSANELWAPCDSWRGVNTWGLYLVSVQINHFGEKSLQDGTKKQMVWSVEKNSHSFFRILFHVYPESFSTCDFQWVDILN